QTERGYVLAQDVHDGRDLVVAAFGQILIAVGCVRYRGGLRWPAHVFGREPMVGNPEEMKLDLDTREVIEPRPGQLGEGIAIELPRAHGHRFAIGKIAVAQEPARTARP